MTRATSVFLQTATLVGLCLLYGCGQSRVPSQDGTLSASGSAVGAVRQATVDSSNLAPRGLFVSRQPKRQVSSLLVAGDSLSISLGEELERSLGQDGGLRFGRLGKVSSGLARPDFFDWDAAMSVMTGRMHPDVALIMLGTNDSKLLRSGDGSQLAAPFGSPEWDQAYAARVQRLIGICRQGNPGVVVFWVGAPVMADQTLSQELKHVNAVIARVVAANRDCYFVDTWELFSGPDREYVSAKPELSDGSALRARDGVHLTRAGAQALAERCLWAMQSRVSWSRPQGQALGPANPTTDAL